MSVPDLYCKGARVWVPDKEKVWVAGELVTVVRDGCVEVMCEGEEGKRVVEVGSHDQLPLLRNPDMLVGANDLTSLSYLHEPAVLQNLSVRFLHSNMIYTYCGIVLVAINPYQSLPIYGNETAAAYRGREVGEMDPHVFAVAEEAFRRMARDQSNQSIIISGESGAGKTVSARYVMRYFATVGGASAETQIERKVLASNPIMEAIGNAKTTRNDNSSRFGKYIEIQFDQKNRITGAHMRTYLLERSRVVTQAIEERNYHIFYQLCAARSEPNMAEYQLGPPESFHYTRQGGSVQIKDVDDQSEFRATTEALKLLGFHSDQLSSIFRFLSSILHLGNVEVGRSDKGGEEVSVVSEGDKHLLTSATLLGVDPAHLALWLSHRRIATVREVFNKPLTPAQSAMARDSLAKHLYSSLFQWIVSTINTSLGGPSPSTSSSSPSTSSSSFIGVLDIYGFEVFTVNNFEQFCINYANEKLQQQFNMHVFKLEQAEYIREEIDWSFIDYYDNQPCIDLIESRLGILDLLDETCKMPGGCDSLFIQKLYDGHSKGQSSHFTKPRTSRSAFQVSHYAGSVQYQSEGFVEKNAEQVAGEHVQLLRTSANQFTAALFKCNVPSTTPSRGRRGAGHVSRPTVGAQFRDSLHGLMTTLNSTTPHYIRCIKPNDRKLPFVFEPQRAVQQLRACGVLETVRLSAAGYPSRWTYNEFFQRYRLLLSSGQVRRNDQRQMCEYILHKYIQDSTQYQFGKTKLFFRAGQLAFFERLRSQRLHEASVSIQRHVRGWVQRRKFTTFRRSTILLQAQARGLLARRLALCLRRTRAAVLIQRRARGMVARRQYHKLREAAIVTQAVFRGRQARKLHMSLLRSTRAVTLQRWVRGWLARRAYHRQLHRVVLAQSCARRWMARRELRRLRIEARSVNHLQQLNRGLEKKVIELQLRLLEEEKRRARAEEERANYEKAVLGAKSEIQRLQSELREVKENGAEDQRSQEANHHSMSEWQQMERELDDLRHAHQQTLAQNASLKDQLSVMQKEFEPECPAPPAPGSTPADCESQRIEKTTFSDSILSPPSSDSHTSMSGEVPSTSLPLLPAKFIQGLSSSTPDMLCGMGMRHDAKSSAVPEQSSMALGQGSMVSGQSEMELEVSVLKQLVEQLEREKENLLLGNREMSQQLTRIDASKMESASALHQILSENSLLQRELQEMREKDETGRHAREEVQSLLRAKASLSSEVANLRQALQQSSSAAALNGSLQQEVARLTEENLGLLETVESLQKEKVALRTPMSPRRRTNPCGADSPRRQGMAVRRQVNFSNKPKPDVSSWKHSSQSELIKELIVDMKPEKVASQIPCLPAHMIFMCLRYFCHMTSSSEQAGLFLDGVVSALQQVAQTAQLSSLSFWLANTCHLVNILSQHTNTGQTSQTSLLPFDLSVYTQKLEGVATSAYRDLAQLIQNRIQPLVVPGLLEYEAIPNISSSRPIGGYRVGSHDPSITVTTITKELSAILDTLQKQFLAPQTIAALMRQTMHVINAFLLNNLLLRRDMCHWSKGMQIRYNLSQLEDWCRGCGLPSADVLPRLQPVVQAAKLLQMKKSTASDAEAICELCTQLNPLQVQKLLTMYTPANEFEERVPASVIRLVAQKNGADTADPVNLMVDITSVLPVSFPFTPSDVNYKHLSLPPSLAHLSHLLTV